MIKVGVLLGGKSIEREVSFNSGRTVCDHLDTQLFQTIPIFQSANGDLYILPWSFLYRGKIADFEHRLEKEAQKITWDDLPKFVDFAFIAMHGAYAEDGRLQAILELFKIPYLGTKLFGSTIGINKILQNKYLKIHGIKFPKGFALDVAQVQGADEQILHDYMHQAEIEFPVIVKPQAEGSSVGVFVAHDMSELIKIIHKSCFIMSSLGQDVMVEEKLQGMEFNTILITDYVNDKIVVLPPTEIILKPGCEIFDYHHKYMPGAANKRTPPHCSEQDLQKIKDTCIATMRALNYSNTARIDGFLTKQGDVVILDSNPISGMGPSSFVFRQAAAIGIGHSQLINHFIKTELKQYHMEKITSTIHNVAKLKVVVLLGGPSNEKEISLESGRNVCYKLSCEKYEIIPIFVDDAMKLYKISQGLLVSTSTKELSALLDQTMLVQWSSLKTIADFVFIALHGGAGENGIVQGTLEMLEIPYNGPSIFASALCMDKFKTAQFLKAQGFDVPESFLLSKQDFVHQNFSSLHDFLKTISYPCIVKPHDDGCSVMVAVPKNWMQLEQALNTIFEEKDYALIEELIVGMELTVGVIGNKNPRAMAPSEAIAKTGLLSMEEKFLPGVGENQTPARLPEEDIALIKQVTVQAFRALNCQGYSRIDCFFQNNLQSPTGKKRIVILECNTLPGLTPATCFFHQAAEEGLKPMQVLDEIVQLGLQAHAPREIISVDQVLQKHEKNF